MNKKKIQAGVPPVTGRFSCWRDIANSMELGECYPVQTINKAKGLIVALERVGKGGKRETFLVGRVKKVRVRCVKYTKEVAK